jgi:hypothetical protein
MSQISLNKIKFSKVSEAKKTNDLIEELNMIIDEIDEYFKSVCAVHQGVNPVKYTYELNSKVNESNHKFLEEFKDDLNGNGYDCRFEDVLVTSKSEPRALVLVIRLTVNISQL